MARFVSRFGKYRHGARRGRYMVLADGQRQELQAELYAIFQPGRNILTEQEIQFGIKSMVHKGLPFDRDNEEIFSPRSRISGFDSLQAQDQYDWSDEEREIVETALRKSPHFGADHLELIPAPVAAPWQTYDVDGVETIILVAKATGMVDESLAYERENANRLEVIEALTAEPETEPTVVVDAS